jgi:hypothetical protein
MKQTGHRIREYEARSMTKQPCEGMTKAEISAFEAIEINRRPNCS